jgi:hypothetical protein
MHHTHLWSALVPTLALTAAATPALAQNLFVVTATGNGNTVTVGADNIINLVDQAVNTQDQFAQFQNVNTTFALNYGGISDAITITKNSGNTQATLTFGPTGTTRTFTGTSQDDLQNQIEDYLKKDGGADFTDFLKAVNAQSVIAVSDGNPNSTTARMGAWSFDHFGFSADQRKGYLVRVDPAATPEPAPQGGGDDAQDSGVSAPILHRENAGFQLYLGASAQTYSAGDFDGETATIFGAADLNFSTRFGLSLGSFLGYNTVGDADVFHVGLTLGVPVRIILPDDATPVTWQVTPFVQGAGSGSEDIGAGGLVYSGGITSYLAWHINDRWTLAMANQFSRFEGEKLSFDDFEIDPGVSQGMMKHALRASYNFGDSWYGYAGAAWSKYMDDASIDSWLSPAVGIGYSSRAGSGIQLGFIGDYGDDYSASGLRIAGNLVF